MNIGSLFRSVALPTLLIAAACGGPAGKEQPPLANARIGGPFTLTDQDGGRVSDRDFAGKFRLIYFGYTYCPDVCPVDLQKLMQGYRRLEQVDAGLAARVQPIFISVDPERDTPPVVKQYVSAFHPKLIGLTGTPQEIDAVAKKFAIYYRRASQEGSTDYLVDHARQTMLFDPQGKPLALIPQEGTPEAIAAEIRRWAT